MAKATAAKQPTEQEMYEALLEQLSPEQRAELLSATGQEQQQGGTKTPTIRVNFNGKADTTSGKKVDRGNFVVGQVVKLDPNDDKKKTVIEAGTDLGSELSAVLLKIGTQYSYFSKNPKDRCSSQILLERNETPIGHNLKHQCDAGTCPRRQADCHKDDKCGNQFVAFFRLPEGTLMPDGTPVPVAMMYFKGINYMPFKDYLKDGLGKTPSIMVQTVMTTEDQDTYFDIICTKGDMVDSASFKENFELVSGISKDLIEHKAQQQDKMQKSLPAPPAAGGRSAKPSTAGDNARDVTPPEAGDDINW